jgi:hypothetical protein
MKKKRNVISGGFVAFPHALLNHPNFLSLSGHATKLLLLIARQYKGRNNGDFQAGWNYAKKHGWKSQDTLHRVKKELLEKGFIAETRKGGFPNKCSLYGITWLALDPDPKFDIKPSGFPVGAWNRGCLALAARSDALNPVGVQGKSRINTPVVSRKLQ